MKKVYLTAFCFLIVAGSAAASNPAANLSALDKIHAGLISFGGDEATPIRTNPETDDLEWTALPDAPVTICRAATGKVGDYIYIFGGQGTGGSNTALAFNIATEMWETSTVAPISGSNWNGTVLGDSVLYVFPKMFGGAEVQKFSPDATGPGGTWSLVTLYPVNNWAFAVAWDGGNYIYCAGGSYPFLADAYKLDLTTNIFEPIAPLPEPRGWVGGAFASGKFYVMGGDNPSYEYTNTCYEYDPVSNTWTSKAPLIKATAFTCFNIATDGEKVYLVGGGGGNAVSIPATDTVQVYDPATDTWYLETNRMNDYGTNAACYVAEGNYLFDAGGRDVVTTYNCTWKGTILGGTAELAFELTPHNPPIIIPPGGGSFQYDLLIANVGTVPATFDAWIKAILPSGSDYYIIIRPGMNMEPGDSLSRANMTQVVPAGAPAGDYAYVGAAGTYPNVAIASDTIYFEKLAGDAGVGWSDHWALSGWIEEGLPEVQAPSSYVMIAAFPNPFNPTTAISYQLSAFSFVNLSVYDLAGRKVAELVNGWREAGTHEVTFDGSNLATGVYLYRLEVGDFRAAGKMVLLK